MKILKKIMGKISSLYNLKRNVNNFCKIHTIIELRDKDLKFRGADMNDLSQINSIYKELNGNKLSSNNIKLLKYCAKKLVIIAEKEINGREKIIGIDLYYMNPRDFQESTVHEGFIGVLPEHEGQGVATQMRKHAIDHFKKVGFKGISTRISKSNIGSLRSAKKLGFKPVEEYCDKVMQEERYYLILHFNEKIN